MVSLFGIRLVPLNIPFERRLQTLAVMQWLITLIIMPVVTSVSFIFLLFSPLYWIALLYLTFVYFFEWNTTKRGGRRFNWVRRWKLWHYLRDYFPISLVKTAELDPTNRYILGYHPHGILPVGAFINFGTEATGFSALFPGIVPYVLTLSINLSWPLLRTYLMSLGGVDVSRESITWLMTKEKPGVLAVIVVGGAEESLNARPNKFVLTILKRKGFIRMALKTGAHLIPSYSFGEINLFNQLNNEVGSKVRRFQEYFKSIFLFAPPIFYGRGIFNYTFGFMPFRKKVATVIGAPIEVSKISEPTTEDVDNLHKVYLTALRNLFDEHKHNYDISEETQLEFI